MILRPHVVIPRRAQALLSYIAAVLIGLLVPPFALGVAVTMTGCDTLKAIGRNVTIDCGKPALQDAVDDIAPTVKTILAGSSVNWQEELDEYKAKGFEALACAVAKVGIALASASKPLMASAVVTPADRAAQYLTSRGLHPANVPR